MKYCSLAVMEKRKRDGCQWGLCRIAGVMLCVIYKAYIWQHIWHLSKEAWGCLCIWQCRQWWFKGDKYLAVARKEWYKESERGWKRRPKEWKKKKKNTWRLHLGRPSQTNEAIKKCETSAVQSARQCNVVHKHNVGRRVVEEEEEWGNLSQSRQRMMSRAWLWWRAKNFWVQRETLNLTAAWTSDLSPLWSERETRLIMW